MQFAVSPAQAEGWKHPLVQEVRQALAVPLGGALSGYAYFSFKAKIRDIILGEGLMTPFLPMPFTAESAEGKRLTAVLGDLKKDFPQREMMQSFRWRFWDPERDASEAQFLAGAIGQEPVLVGACVA